VSLADVTVLDIREAASLGGFFPVDARLLDAQERAASELSRRGARVRTAGFPALRDAIALWAAAMDDAAETPYAMMLGNGTKLRLRDVLGEFRAQGLDMTEARIVGGGHAATPGHSEGTDPRPLQGEAADPLRAMASALATRTR
jgi:hypothetical protein